MQPEHPQSASQQSQAQAAGCRVRLRLRKTGDLRLISHRDLVRTVERLFRRADVTLRMTQGFHPKPKINFPSALGLGIEGLDELVEVEIDESIPPDELLARLNEAATPGLEFLSARQLGPEEKKAQPQAAVYEFVLPQQQQSTTAVAVERLLASEHLWIDRERSGKGVDVRPLVQELELAGDVLRMKLRITGQQGIRPREVLDALGIAAADQLEQPLRRTKLEIQSE